MTTSRGFSPLITILVVAGIIVLGVAAYVVWTGKLSPSAVPTQTPSTTTTHTWTTYESTALGLTLTYPADLLTPIGGNATATSSISFYKSGAETGKDPHIVITREDTDVATAAEYFAKYLPNTDPGIISNTTVDGVPALEALETAYAQITAYVVQAHTLYTISINLPPAEAEQVKNSIRFIRP